MFILLDQMQNLKLLWTLHPSHTESADCSTRQLGNQEPNTKYSRDIGYTTGV